MNPNSLVRLFDYDRPWPPEAPAENNPSQRCTGHCCEVFYLPVTQDELRASLDERESPTPAHPDGKLRYRGYYRLEREAIADMVIPLAASWDELPPELQSILAFVGETPDGPARYGSNLARGGYFTCKHFDREQRMCTNYLRRPKMCRDYPYNSPCPYTGCTSACARKEPDGEQPQVAGA